MSGHATYEEYLADFDPSPSEPGEGYLSPLSREDWEAEFGALGGVS